MGRNVALEKQRRIGRVQAGIIGDRGGGYVGCGRGREDDEDIQCHATARLSTMSEGTKHIQVLRKIYLFFMSIKKRIH